MDGLRALFTFLFPLTLGLFACAVIQARAGSVRNPITEFGGEPGTFMNAMRGEAQCPTYP